MRKVKIQFTLILMLVIQFGYSQKKDMFFKEANTFFENYVDGNNFNYAAAKNSPMIGIFINDIANTDLESLSPDIRKAYMINAYNILVINLMDFLIKKSILSAEKKCPSISLKKKVY